MPQLEHGVLRERLQRYSDEREKIGDRDGASFFLRRRAALDQRVEGHHEKSARGAEQGQQRRDNPKTEAWPRDRKSIV